jgi:hypothetical protein
MVSLQEHIDLLGRLPMALKTWIEQHVERNGASQTRGIVRSILARMDRDERVLR